MTGTGGLGVTAGRGGGPDLAPGPGPAPGLALATGEIGATAGTEGPPGGRGVTPETVNQDPRVAADPADQSSATLSVCKSKYFPKCSTRLVCAKLS